MTRAKITLIVLLIMGTTIGIVKHWEDRGEYNVWSTLLNLAILLVIYYYAGVLDVVE